MRECRIDCSLYLVAVSLPRWQMSLCGMKRKREREREKNQRKRDEVVLNERERQRER